MRSATTRWLPLLLRVGIVAMLFSAWGCGVVWGQAIFSLQEFHEHWKTTKRPLFVVLKGKNLPRFADNLGEPPLTLASREEYVLVSKR